MSGPWEDFGGGGDVKPWEEFAPKPQKIGMDAFPDFLRQELANSDAGTKFVAAFGTPLSNAYEALKQFIGKGDAQQVEANRIIERASPAGAIAGNVAMTAIPFGMAGNSVNTAAKIGAGLGALTPVEGESVWNKEGVGQKLKEVGLSSALSAGGQAIANTAGQWFADKLAKSAADATKNAPRTKTLNDAMNAGLVVPPSSVDPSWWNTLKEGIGGKIATAQAASNQNAETIDAMVRTAVGLPENAPLTSEAMQQIRRQAFANGYAPIARAGELPVSQEYGQALDGLVQKYVDASESFPGVAAPDIQALVDSYKPRPSRFSPEALRQNAQDVLQGLIGDRNTSRIGALQETGKLQTEAAQALDRANNFVPVAGMPRVPASLSPNLERANEYASAVPDAAALVGQRGAQRDALSGLANRLDVGPLPSASFDAQHALVATQVLRDQAREAFRQGATQVGRTKRDIADEIENELERQLFAQGADAAPMLQSFRDARTLMAKSHDIEDAIVEGGGTIDPRVLARKYQNQEPLSGELATIGAFANNFGKATQPAKQVAGPGVSNLGLALSLLGGGIEGGAWNLALQVAGRPLMRRQLLSSRSQNRLRDIYRLGLAPRVAAGALQYAPVAGAVLGREALSQ